MKKYIILCLLAVLCLGRGLAQAVEGSCGNGLKWQIDGAFTTLTIYRESGSDKGVMDDYTRLQKAPWYYYHSDIETLVLMDSVETLGDYAFFDFTRLSNIVCQTPIVPVIASNSVFGNVDLDNATLSVRGPLVNEFKKAYGWRNFTHLVNMGFFVTFHPGNGQDDWVQTVKEIDYIIDTVPEHTDSLVFGGWFTSPDWYGLNRWDSFYPQYPYYCYFKEDFDLYALFTDTANLHTVFFVEQDTVIDTVYVLHNFQVQDTVSRVRTGYNFDGWYYNGKRYDSLLPVTRDITLSALWEPIQYPITYSLDSGTNAEKNPDSYTIESGEIVLAAPSRLGYTFLGWITLSGAPANDTIPAGSTGARDFIAQWSLNTYTIEYDSTTMGEDGVFPDNPVSYTVQDGEIILNPPVRPFYTGFWSDNGIIREGDTGNKVFRAIWVENKATGVDFVTINSVGQYQVEAEGTVSGQGTFYCGFLVSTEHNAKLNDPNTLTGYATSMSEDGVYTAVVARLQPSTTYFIRAFAYCDGDSTHIQDTLYSAETAFNTRSLSNIFNLDLVYSATRTPSLVDMVLRITDGKGKGADYFSEKDFSVYEDNRPLLSTETHYNIRKIVSLEEEAESTTVYQYGGNGEIPFEMNTMLVLDYTSSLNGNGHDGFQYVRQAAADLIRNRLPMQKFGLVVFCGTEPTVLVEEFTDDTAYLMERLYSVTRPGNTTSLLEAYNTALDLMPVNDASVEGIKRNFMVVFTDGMDVLWMDNRFDSLLNEAVQHRDELGVNVYTVGTYGDDVKEEDHSYQDYILEKLGSPFNFYTDVNIEALPEVFVDIQTEMRRDILSMYHLTYMSPQRSGRHTVKMTLESEDLVEPAPEYTFSAADFTSANFGLYLNPTEENVFGWEEGKTYTLNDENRLVEAVSYWADYSSEYVWTSSNNSVVKVEQKSFSYFDLVPGQDGNAILTVIDKSNYDYAASGENPTIPAWEAWRFKRTFNVTNNNGTLTVVPISNTLFTVTYNTAGGLPVPDVLYTEGQVVEPGIEPEREGYRFTGWYAGPDPYNFEQPVKANLTLTAGWYELPKLNVVTLMPTGIANDSAILRASVTGSDLPGCTVGFMLAGDPYYSPATYVETEPGECTVSVNGLNESGEVNSLPFYVKAYAVKNNDTVWGNEVMFRNRPLVDPYYKIKMIRKPVVYKPYFVDVVLSVSDYNNRGVGYLDDDDFVLNNGGEITGKTSEFFRYTRKLESLPITIKTLLLLDNSSSIGYKTVDEVKKAAIGMVKNKNDKQAYAVAVFSDTLQMLTDYTTNLDTLLQCINSIRPGAASTNLYDAYVKALETVPCDTTTALDENGRLVSGCMILVSDGSHTQTGANDINSALEARKEKQVYVVGLGQETTNSILWALSSDDTYFYPIGVPLLAGTLKEVHHDIVREANRFYKLTCLTDKRAKHGEITLEVSLRENNNSGFSRSCSATYQSPGMPEDEIMWYGTYLNIYENIDKVSLDDNYVNKYGLGLPDEMDRDRALSIADAENLPDAFILKATTYGTYVTPQFVWSSSDTNVVKVEPIDFDKARLIYQGISTNTVTVTVRDIANRKAVADYTYRGVVQPYDSVLYERSVYIRNIPRIPPVFTPKNSLSDAFCGKEYADSIYASGEGVSYFLTEGTLPKGLNLDSVTGRISGYPLQGGDFNLVFAAANTTATVTMACTLHVEKVRGGVVGEIVRPIEITNYYEDDSGQMYTSPVEDCHYAYTRVIISPVEAPDNATIVNNVYVPAQEPEYAFYLEGDTANWQTLNYFRVSSMGRYIVCARAKESDFYYAGPMTRVLSETLEKAKGDSVGTPVLCSKTPNSITIHSVAGPASGQEVEYSINTFAAASLTWVSDTVFENLVSDTRYYIFARAKEDSLFQAGYSNGFLVVVVQKNNGAYVEAPTLKAVSSNTITVNPVEPPYTGQEVEYCISSEKHPTDNWQTSTYFANLETDNYYYIFARSKENETYSAGGPSDYLRVEIGDAPQKEAADQAVEAAKRLVVYPNPTRDRLTLQVSAMEGTPVFLTDASGKTVLTAKIEGEKTQIDLSDLNPGVYFVKIGEVIRKVVKR